MNTCKCVWCKKNVSANDADKVRINFVSGVFYLMFANLFDSVGKEKVKNASDEFDKIITKFVSSEKDERIVDDLFEAVVDICFYTIGLDTKLSPYTIAHTCGSIQTAITNAFKVLHVDQSVEETPILIKFLTPRMFVDHELGKSKLPQELLDIYKRNSKYEMQELVETLHSSIEEVFHTGSTSSQTFH